MNRFAAVLIRAGAFQGVSPPKPIRFSRRALADAAPSMQGKPVKLNHDSAKAKIAGAVVGHVANVRFSDDSVIGEIVLDPNAEHYAVAKAFIESQLALGGIPNLSIEGGFSGFDNGVEYDVSSIEFTALALVSRGACSDLAGCGVVAALSQGVTPMDENTTAAATPSGATATTTFEVVTEAELAAPAKAVDMTAELAAARSATVALEAKLADSEKALAAVKVALADSEAALANERAKLPVLVALSALAPSYPTEGKTLCELKAALEMAKLAPATPGRVSLMAEPAVPVDPRKVALEAFSAKVDRYMKR